MSDHHDHHHDEHNHDDHHHHGLGHSHGANAPHKILMVAIVLTFAFAIVEALGGWFANSLTLLGDAGHMGSDALALGIAAFAAWISLKPPSHKHSYGLGRAEVVAAWVSSLLMLIISLAVIIEAIERFNSPHTVKGIPVMIIAFIGLLVNIFIAWMLAKGERTLNIRAAMLHVLGDILGSVAALTSGAIIYFAGWYLIDPILSIFIGLLIMFSSLRLMRESLLVLMEGVPGHIEMEEVNGHMSAIDGVNSIHDLHIWNLSSGIIALSAHIDIHELHLWEDTLTKLKAVLKKRFKITHVTLQPELETENCQSCPCYKTSLLPSKNQEPAMV